MTNFKPYLHLGSNLMAGPNWQNIDGSTNVFLTFVFEQYGWKDRGGEWKIWIGKYNNIRRFVTLAVLLFERTFRHGKWPVQIYDLRKPLPFADETFKAVYSSHTIEHLHYDQALNLLRESYRVLKAGGILRTVVPDLRAFVYEYLDAISSGDTTGNAADHLNRRLLLREPHSPHGNLWQRIRFFATDFHTHKWMYDIDSLCQLTRQIGFIDIKQCEYLQSEIPVIEEVEVPSRLEAGQGICIEAKKPDRHY